MGENCTAWMKYSELETLLGDIERARGIYELAVEQPRLDMPEILWKAYIDFECELEETDKARDLYRRLLGKTQHVKVWLSYAQFEFQVEHEDNILQAKHIFEQANKSLREASNASEAKGKESRLLLLEAWQEFEEEQGDEITQNKVRNLMPKRIKKRRKIESDDPEVDAGWEEYFDYIFPEDEGAKPNLKLLAMAKMWKKQKETEPPTQTHQRDDEVKEEEEAPSGVRGDSQSPEDERKPLIEEGQE